MADAQEAADDCEDAREKHMGHGEAWERMLEYQHGQIGKREAAAEEGAGAGGGR